MVYQGKKYFDEKGKFVTNRGVRVDEGEGERIAVGPTAAEIPHIGWHQR